MFIISDKTRRRSAVSFKISMKIEIFSFFLSFLSEILFESVKKKIKIVSVVVVAVSFVVAVAVFSVVVVAVFSVVKVKISFKR